MHVGLNLATKPLVSHRRFFLAAGVVGAVASLLLLYLAYQFFSLRQADANFRAKLGSLDQQMERLQLQRDDLQRFFAKEENQHLQDRAKFIGAVIEARSFNWTKMFMDLEHTLPPGVHVVKIEPKLDNGSATVKFEVAGSSEESKVKLLRAFEDSRSFTHVELTQEGLPRQGGNNQSSDVFSIQFSAIYTGI